MRLHKSYNPGQNVWDTSPFMPNSCNIRSLLPPLMQCWTTSKQAFPYEQRRMGEGGGGRGEGGGGRGERGGGGGNLAQRTFVSM